MDDEFIVILLKYYDKHVSKIEEKEVGEPLFNHFRNYYEQLVRILYHFVIYEKIRESGPLHMIFSYLFPFDKDNFIKIYGKKFPHKLIDLFIDIRDKTSWPFKDISDREYIDVFIGEWNTEERRLEHIEVDSVLKNMYVYTIAYIHDDAYKEEYNVHDGDDYIFIESDSDDDEIILDNLKYYLGK